MTTQKRPDRFSSGAQSIPFKRILAVFSITCTVLYIVCWVGEFVQATREKMEGPQPREQAPKKPLTDRAKENVQRQIEEIRRVDARDLGLTFVYDLKMWDCNWLFHCVPSKAAVGYFLHELYTHHGDYNFLLQHLNASIRPDVAESLRLERGYLGPGRVPGGANQKPADSWNSFKLPPPEHVWGIPDPNFTPPSGKAPAVPPAASKTKPLSSSDPVSIAERATRPSMHQAPSTPKPDPPTGLDLFETLPGVDIRHAANDEPPTPDEFGFAFNSPEPKLLVKGPIPTLHTLLGIPRATFVAIRAILKAGPWAITIFIACGILYFGVGAPLITILLRDRGKKGWDALLPTLIVLLCLGPVAVPGLVGGVQWAAAALGNVVSWMLGLWVVVAAQSAAIGVLVGIPHVVKSPREVKEAYHVIRHGVEAIEKE